MSKINLIPDVMVQSVDRRRRIRQWTTLGAVAVGLLMIPVTAESWRQAQAADLRGESRNLTAELTKLRDEVQGLSLEAQDVFLRIERANALRSKRAWSAMLNLLAQTMPAGSWLTTVETDPPVPPANAPPVAPPIAEKTVQGAAPAAGPQTITIEAPRRLRISGYAVDATEPLLFVTALKQTGAFQRVLLERSLRERVEQASYFRFELVCEW